MDLIIPPGLNISSCTVRYQDNTGMSAPTYGGPILTSSLGNDKLGMSLSFTRAGGASTESRTQRRQMMGFLARMQGKQNRFYSWDRSYNKGGSFATGELLPNGDFSNGVTGWTSADGDVTISAADGVLKLYRANNDQTDVAVYSSALTAVAGATYAARACVVGGHGGAKYKIRLGTTAGGAEIAESALVTTDGMTTLTGAAPGTTIYFSIIDYNSAATYRVGGDSQDVHYASVSRCMLVGAGGGTGNLIQASQFDTATDALSPGDQFEAITSIGSELKIVTSALVGPGAGYVQFSPPLRGTVSVGAAIIAHRPCAKWIYTGGQAEWSNDPGVVTTSSIEFEESQ